MIRSPAFLILTFVFSSMLAGVLIWNVQQGQAQQSSNGGETSLSSKTPAKPDPIQVAMEQDKLVQQVVAASGVMSVSDSKSTSVFDKNCEVCAISSAGKGSEDFAFETEKSCQEKSGDKRLYFQKELKKIPENYRSTRDPKNVSAEFPRECVTYIMRHAAGVPLAIQGKASPNLKYYSKCNTPEGKPTHYEWPLCITEEYVNTVYYSFSDVFSCFGISQKALLPKLFQESGMHINALGSGMDAGLGQLTSGAKPTADGVAKLEKEINEKALANNPACLRVQNFIHESNARAEEEQLAYAAAKKASSGKGAASGKAKSTSSKSVLMKPSAKIDLNYFVNHTGTDTRCELIEPPENPFLNIFYMAAKLRDDEKTIENYAYQTTAISITVKAGKGGKPKTISQGYTLRQMIDVSGLSKQVQSDEAFNKLIEMANIHAYNMGPKGAVDGLLKNFFKMKISQGKKVTKEDFNFHVDENLVKRNIKTKKDSDLTYPEFVLKHYPPGIGGAKTYLVKMAGYADTLNTDFKEGTCVPNGFLHL